jgi:hypothetical protein
MIATQFGDDETLVNVIGGGPPEMVSEFVTKTFGFRNDMIGTAVAMPVVFTVVFASVFAFGIKYLNFQQR